jgi:hypothetical protein
MISFLLGANIRNIIELYKYFAVFWTRKGALIPHFVQKWGLCPMLLKKK